MISTCVTVVLKNITVFNNRLIFTKHNKHFLTNSIRKQLKAPLASGAISIVIRSH